MAGASSLTNRGDANREIVGPRYRFFHATLELILALRVSGASPRTLNTTRELSYRSKLILAFDVAHGNCHLVAQLTCPLDARLNADAHARNDEIGSSLE